MKNQTAPVDSAGVTFDPAIHQAFKTGKPRTTKDGRFFTKSRVDIVKARKRAARTAPPHQPAIPDTAPVEPAAAPVGGHDGASTAPATAPEPPPTAPAVAPVEHGPAQLADIISEFPSPTVTPGDPEPPPTAPEGPAPTESTVAPEPAAPDAAAAASAGSAATAAFVTRLIESGASVGFDAPDEWAMRPEERGMIQAALTRKFDEAGGVALTANQELCIALGMYAAPRVTKPKTRAKLLKVWDWCLGLMGRRRKAATDSAPAQPPVNDEAKA